nr:M23 family metallopeptidase [Paenibacillus sp. oral taxon 786]
MNLRKWLSATVFVIFVTLLFLPLDQIYAKTVSQLDNELKQLQERAKIAEQKQKAAEKQQQEAKHYVNKNKNYIKQILIEIESVSEELTKIAIDAEQAEAELRQTNEKLDKTKQRVEERSKWLDSRIRLMYTDGNVSYLDVLLSSTSFIDFLERAEVLQAIANQDRMLLDEYKKDKELLLEQQRKLKESYEKIEALYVEAESRKSALENKEDEKQQLIARYSEEIEESEDISEEQEALLIELATKRAILEKEKNKLKSEQVYTYKSTNSNSSSGKVKSGSGAMSLPIPGARLSSKYGTRVHPVTGEVKMHKGVDYAAPQGTEIQAAESGVVIVAEWWSGYGNTVIVDHGDNVWTLYAHIRNNGIKVTKGDKVKRGQKIAEVGSTGTATGNNLHFEVRIDGKPVDPLPYLK